MCRFSAPFPLLSQKEFFCISSHRRGCIMPYAFGLGIILLFMVPMIFLWVPKIFLVMFMKTYELPICLRREVVTAYHREEKFFFWFLFISLLLFLIYILHRLSSLISGGVGTGSDPLEELRPDLITAIVLLLVSVVLLFFNLKIKTEDFLRRLDWALLCQKYATVSGRIAQIKVDAQDSSLLYLTLHSDNDEGREYELKITKATWDVSANLLQSSVMVFYDAKSLIRFIGLDQ